MNNKKQAVGLFTNLLISGKRASALVADKRIKGVSLTGSEADGASIAAEAGKHLKNLLELGGSEELSALGMDEFVNKKLIRVSELSDPF